MASLILSYFLVAFFQMQSYWGLGLKHNGLRGDTIQLTTSGRDTVQDIFYFLQTPFLLSLP